MHVHECTSLPLPAFPPAAVFYACKSLPLFVDAMSAVGVSDVAAFAAGGGIRYALLLFPP